MPWNVGLLLNTIMFLATELQTGFLQFCSDNSINSVLLVAWGSVACNSCCSDCGSNFIGMGHVHASDADRLAQIGSRLQYAYNLAARGLKQALLVIVAFSVEVMLRCGGLVASIRGVYNVQSLLQSVEKLIVAQRERGTSLCFMQRRLC